MANKVGSLYAELDANTAKFSRALKQAGADARAASREMRAAMREAQGAIALAGEEIGVHMPRHLRAFVAQLPGVAPALSAAFSSIAVVGLGKILAETGEKAVEAIKKIRDNAGEIGEGFDKLRAEGQLSNDLLDVTNDRLAVQIAKLEHKPGDGLKLALDQARVSADQLGKTLEADNQKVEQLLKAHQVGVGGILLGQASTSDVSKKIGEYDQALKEIDKEQSDRVRNAKTAAEAAAANTDAETKRQKTLGEAIHWANTQWNERTALQKGQKVNDPDISKVNSLNQTANLTILGNMAEVWQQESDRSQKMQLEATQQATLDQLTARKEAADEAKRVAHEAAQAQMQEMRSALEADRAGHQLSLAEEAEFWQSRLLTVKMGAENIRVVTDEMNKAIAAVQRETEKTNEDFAKQTDAVFNDLIRRVADESDKIPAGLGEASKQIVEKLNSVRSASPFGAFVEGTEQIERNTEALKAAQGGVLSYQQQLVLAAQTQDNMNRYLQSSAELLLREGTAADGVRAFFLDMQQSGITTAMVIEDAFKKSFDGIAEQLGKLMSGQKTSFAKTFQGIFQQAGTSELKKTMQMGLGALVGKTGMGGKPDGSKGNAFFVRNADGPMKLPGGAGSPVSGLAGGLLGKLNDSNFLSSLFGGKLFGSGSIFGSLIPHATGGSVTPGVGYLVGERGPEPFFPGVSGTIATNAAMQRSMSGPSGAYYHVDARGTDPALTGMNVQRALAQVHGKAVADAARTMAEQQKRKSR